MYESFDAFEYIDYLRRRWVFMAVACGVAILIVLPASLLLPKRYTATASIAIEPPGGADPRTSTAISPVYLESLKAYERLAESDSLFERAVERFHLRSDQSQPIESLKRGVLRVSKVRDTKILEISVTLRDPRLAQNVAQYVAEQTANLNRDENVSADSDSMAQAQKTMDEARLRLEKAQSAVTEVATREPVEALQTEVDAGADLQSRLREQLIQAQADVAEYQERATQPDAQFARDQLPAARARAATLEKQSRDVEKSVQDKSAMLARRLARRASLDADLKMARDSYDSAAARLRDLHATAGSRGERLQVIDPGIVPQRPSSPNVPLNTGVAMFLALIASLVYLSFAFVYRRRSVGYEPAVSRGMRA